MTPLMIVNIIQRKPMIPDDTEKFEHKGTDKANKRTCMFDAKSCHESKYVFTI